MEPEHVSMREAREMLGVSNFTIWQMVKDGRLPAYESRTDRRKKLIRVADIRALMEPGSPVAEAKKAAA